MQALRQTIRSDTRLLTLFGALFGVLLSFVYAWVRAMSMPLNFRLFGALVSPDTGFLGIAAVNLLMIVAAGAIASTVVLIAFQLLLMPTRMVFLVVSAVAFLATQGWQLLSHWTEFIANDKFEYAALKLSIPLCVAAVFLVGSLWLVRHNSANTSLNPDAPQSGAPVS